MREDLKPAVDAGRVLTELRAQLPESAGLRALTLDRAWPWGRDGLCALYLEPRDRGLEKAWAVLRSPSAGLPGVVRRALGPGGPVQLPGLGLLAMGLAADPELSAAGLALNGSAAGKRLRVWLPDGDPGTVEVRPRSYKPLRRLTLEYRIRRGDGRVDRLFAKLLRGPDLERTLGVCRALEGSRCADALALPCDVVTPWSLMVFGERPGTGLDRLIPGPAAVHGVTMAASALASLHTGGARLPSTHSRRRELETTERWVRCAGRAFPELAAALVNALRLLASAAPRLPSGPPLPGHRDFHPGQLQVAPDGASILDPDTAAEAEPELDGGNFLAHLDLYELDRPAVPAACLAAEFREAYAESAGRDLHPDRLRWYRAASLLRLACVYRFRPRGAILGPRLIHRARERLGSREVSLEVI